MINSYRDLDVWKLAMNFAERCYQLTKDFPKEEMFGLTSQLRRSAVSIAANIAEGHSRCSTRDFLRFLGITNGSLAESETHIELAYRAAIMNETTRNELLSQTRRIGQMVIALRRSLRRHLEESQQ